RGASTAAFQVGYTIIQFVAPAAADLTFTPPPGATVTQENLGSGDHGHAPADTSGYSTIGHDWLTVLKVPSSDLTSGPHGPGSGAPASGNGDAVLRTLLNSATAVHGAWGSGRLLRTSLVSVLITDSGTAYVGAVRPSVLYAAAAGK
ncbi:MAG TPA: DUF2092 domain-containing protein, partial [Trebonia sp.]